MTPVIVSRTDRIGDLVLSLPTLGYLKQCGFDFRILHVARANLAIAQVAHFNGLCESIWIQGQGLPISKEVSNLQGFNRNSLPVLVLAPTVEARSDFSREGLTLTYTHRNRLSHVWNFRHTLAQHRSRVEMSEMEYNLDLARWMVERLQSSISSLRAVTFEGLKPLRIPEPWASQVPVSSELDMVINVLNRGSAENWTLEQYLEYGLRAEASGRHFTYLVSGEGERHVIAQLSERLKAQGSNAHVQGTFASLEDLLVFLSRARHVVSSSTGTLHLAHALGVEVTGIFPSARVRSFARWRPHGYWHDRPVHWIEWQKPTNS